METNCLQGWRFHRFVRRTARSINRLHQGFQINKRTSRLRNTDAGSGEERPQKNRRTAGAVHESRMESRLSLFFPKRTDYFQRAPKIPAGRILETRLSRSPEPANVQQGIVGSVR